MIVVVSTHSASSAVNDIVFTTGGPMEFLGFVRPDGRVGVRNHLLILPTVACAGETSRRIASHVPGAVAANHAFGCGMLGADFEQFRRTLRGVGDHPNVGAVLTVGLGCEQIDAGDLAAELAKSGAQTDSVIIQRCGGERRTIREGVKKARAMARILARRRRVPAPVSKLMLAVECGGSDFSSGLAANPAAGWAANRVVELGGTAVLSETTEVIGGEHLLAKRAVNRGTARALYRLVRNVETCARRAGVDIRGSQPTPGNIRGGLTTIEEKSLGCIYKSGTSPLRGVVEYGERIRGAGLWFMDSPGFDIESDAGMAAGGAQVIVFTTGLGTPVGCPIVPVIKMTGNPETARRMREHIDLDAGTVLRGRETIEEVGRRVFRLVLDVARGRLTKAERSGHNEFGITRIGMTI
jgi:altronate dehydratase large subunit